MMKVLGSTKIKITKDKNGKNVSRFEVTKIVSVRCNNVNNDYQKNLRVLYPDKSFGERLDISPKN